MRREELDIKINNDITCPICGEKDYPPPPAAMCNCPTMVYVPAGRHIHHNCPVHGDVVIHGNSVYC